MTSKLRIDKNVLLFYEDLFCRNSFEAEAF